MGIKVSQNQFASTSRKPAPEGCYLGVVCGFADLGWQEGQYGPKRQVMICWELRDTKDGSPVLDDEGKPFVVNNPYPFTVNPDFAGNPSRFAQCLAAHGLDVNGGKELDMETDIKGRVALLEVGLDASQQYARVQGIALIEDPHRQLGKDGKLKRTLPFTYWDADRNADPPGWAWGLLRQGDLFHRVPGARGTGRDRAEPPHRPWSEQGAHGGGGDGGAGSAAASQRGLPGPSSGRHPAAGGEDEDIPF
ncbi:MAG TPA: hypothetical protein VMV94_07040 [Phycisphaerae bacterium]|nr:hypothetical protein [Phycisphaerae bacterium]